MQSRFLSDRIQYGLLICPSTFRRGYKDLSSCILFRIMVQWFLTHTDRAKAAFLAQKHNVNLYFEWITKCPKKRMHKTKEQDHTICSCLSGTQPNGSVRKGTKTIQTDCVWGLGTKYFPRFFKDLGLSSTPEDKIKKYSIWLWREPGCHKSVDREGWWNSFLVAMAKAPRQSNLRKSYF